MAAAPTTVATDLANILTDGERQRRETKDRMSAIFDGIDAAVLTRGCKSERKMQTPRVDAVLITSSRQRKEGNVRANVSKKKLMTTDSTQ